MPRPNLGRFYIAKLNPILGLSIPADISTFNNISAYALSQSTKPLTAFSVLICKITLPEQSPLRTHFNRHIPLFIKFIAELEKVPLHRSPDWRCKGYVGAGCAFGSILVSYTQNYV